MKWHALLGLLLSLGFGVFMFLQVDFARLGAALHTARYSLLVLAMLTQVLTHLVRVWRWKYLMDPVTPVSRLSLLSATAIGFMANMILPAHAGEVIRAYVVSRREPVSTMAALATIVVERMADLVSIVLILIGVVLAPGLPVTQGPLEDGLRLGGIFAAGLGVVLIGSLWSLRTRTAQTLSLLERLLRPVPRKWRGRIVEALAGFASGLHVLSNGRHLLIVLGLSLGLWGMIAYTNFLVFRAFGVQLPMVAAFFVLVVQIVSAVIPSAPGYIGTFHAAVVASLAVFQIAPEIALSMAIMMHAAFFFPFILIGLGFLWKESLSLRDLRAVETSSLESKSS